MKNKCSSLFGRLKTKEKGLSTMFCSIFVLVLLLIMFYMNYHIKAIETLSENVRSDADAATMAATTVNLNKYGLNTGDFRCIGNADVSSNNVNDNEKNEVFQHFKLYASSIVSTSGMVKNDVSKTGFKGGNLGWASSVVGMNGFTLNNFEIHDFKTDNAKLWHVSYIVTKSDGSSKFTINDLVNISNGTYTGLKITKSVEDLNSVTAANNSKKKTITTKNGTAGTYAGFTVSNGSYTKDVLCQPTVFASFSFKVNTPPVYRWFADLGWTADNTTSGVDITINSVSQAEETTGTGNAEGK